MLKSLIPALCLLASACATTAPQTTYNEFDGGSVVDVDTHATHCANMQCSLIGAQWQQRNPDAVILTIGFSNLISNVTDVQFMIDGDKVTLPEPRGLTNYERIATLNTTNSTNDFITDLSVIERINAADTVLIRISSTDGYIDNAVKRPGSDSRASKALYDFIQQVNAVKM